MATTIEDLERRVQQLEYELQRMKSNLDDAARHLKRAQDSEVQTAGRRMT